MPLARNTFVIVALTRQNPKLTQPHNASHSDLSEQIESVMLPCELLDNDVTCHTFKYAAF